jgi:uncharacterized protein YprB with RNaseH-like and TPR domain
MSLKKQLERYKRHLARPAENGTPPEQAEPIHPTPAVPHLTEAMQEAAERLEAEVRTFEGEAILVKEQTIPLDQYHGRRPLNDIFEAVAMWQHDPEPHPLSTRGLSAEDLLFFDTETTGLSSGAGHMIFLLGCGAIRGDRLQLTQYFLPGPGNETAFYYHFLTDVKALSNLVTYNGKAFDWPRVKTRVQFVRDAVPKLPAFGHFDLLHAARRLWKHRLESMRLSAVEETVLGFKRSGDIPGHMAPFLYFEFLKRPKASLIEGIFRHNADDIKTLVALYSHLSRLIHGNGVPLSGDEAFEIARWFAALRRYDRAIALLESLDPDEPGIGRAGVHGLLAECYKKSGATDKALETYLYMVEHGLARGVSDYVEIAKMFEHHYKAYESALSFTERALDRLERETALPPDKYEKERWALEQRRGRLLARLGQKIAGEDGA